MQEQAQTVQNSVSVVLEQCEKFKLLKGKFKEILTTILFYKLYLALFQTNVIECFPPCALSFPR